MPGFALPRVFFITSPTKNPTTLVLPALYFSISLGFAARISAMALSMAPLSLT